MCSLGTKVAVWEQKPLFLRRNADYRMTFQLGKFLAIFFKFERQSFFLILTSKLSGPTFVQGDLKNSKTPVDEYVT